MSTLINRDAYQQSRMKVIMMSNDVKQAVLELLDRLPEECTWDDVMTELYVRQKIAAGLADLHNGRIVAHEAVFAEFNRHED